MQSINTLITMYFSVKQTAYSNIFSFVYHFHKLRRWCKSLCLHIANYVIKYIMHGWFATLLMQVAKPSNRKKGKVL